MNGDVCSYLGGISLVFHSCVFSDEWYMVNMIDEWWLVINRISGWWFGTFFIFPNSWDDDPIWLIFFRGVETTNQIIIVNLWIIITINIQYNLIYLQIILYNSNSIYNSIENYNYQWICWIIIISEYYTIILVNYSNFSDQWIIRIYPDLLGNYISNVGCIPFDVGWTMKNRDATNVNQHLMGI